LYITHTKASATPIYYSTIAWRKPRDAKRIGLLDCLAGDTYCQAPSASSAHYLQVLPGGTPLAAKRLTFQFSFVG